MSIVGTIISGTSCIGVNFPRESVMTMMLQTYMQEKQTNKYFFCNKQNYLISAYIDWWTD
eukprot:5383636-Ditylum_brightwellii.AAC.1